MTQPPGILFIYLWMEEPVFLRIVQNGDRNRIPPCPRLYDEVVQIPVVDNGQEPPREQVKRTLLVADWLVDIMETS